MFEQMMPCIADTVRSEVRMELSLPGFGLHDLSYPSSFPSPPSDDLEQDSARAWYYYLAEIALRRLANRVLYHLFRNQDKGRFPRIMDMVESTAAFEAQAADWYDILFRQRHLYEPALTLVDIGWHPSRQFYPFTHPKKKTTS